MNQDRVGLMEEVEASALVLEEEGEESVCCEMRRDRSEEEMEEEKGRLALGDRARDEGGEIGKNVPNRLTRQ